MNEHLMDELRKKGYVVREVRVVDPAVLRDMATATDDDEEVINISFAHSIPGSYADYEAHWLADVRHCSICGHEFPHIGTPVVWFKAVGLHGEWWQKEDGFTHDGKCAGEFQTNRVEAWEQVEGRHCFDRFQFDTFSALTRFARPKLREEYEFNRSK